MTALFRRLIARHAPFYVLWLAERRRHAVTRADLEAHKLHFAVAVAQRDAARDLFAAIVGVDEPGPAWVDEAESWANGGRA